MARTPVAPLLASSRVMGLTAGAFYGAGGTAAMAVILTAPFADAGDRRVLLGLASLALVTGLALVLWGRLLPRGAFHVVVGAGALLITLAVPLCPTTPTALAITTVYAFIAIDVMFFFGWAAGAVHLLVLFLAAGWALHGLPGVTTGVRLALAVVCLVITAVVGTLVRLAANANHDSLTGLRNRRGFDAALDEVLVQARSDEPVVAVLLDVDHFKVVNDTHGHAAGDRLLKDLAGELALCAPAGAVLARYGGDEFAVLVTGLTGRGVLEHFEGMCDGLQAAACSVGIAQLFPGESGADLVRRADAALYAAKLSGRGRCRLDDLDSTELARDLAAGIAAGQVRAWFQPIVTPATGEVVGVEALARWTHASRGPVRPDEFIPVAESSDLIVDLGAAVMADACHGASALVQAWGRPVLLTVNVSGRELTSTGYVERVLSVLETTGWPARLLVVEVTESLLDGSSHGALQALGRLREAGISVAIDDFGTGYSAFSRLDTVPADYLKLDHGFTAEITTSPRRAGVLQALLSLAAALDLEVIAEGVETREQADLLTDLGCPLAQGWLYAPALPPADLASAPPACSVPLAPSTRLARTAPSTVEPAGVR